MGHILSALITFYKMGNALASSNDADNPSSQQSPAATSLDTTDEAAAAGSVQRLAPEEDIQTVSSSSAGEQDEGTGTFDDETGAAAITITTSMLPQSTLAESPSLPGGLGSKRGSRRQSTAPTATAKTANDRIALTICGACERTRPKDSFNAEQRGLRQSSRRCEECVASGNQLVLMRKGLERAEEDECPICNLPVPLAARQSMSQACCMKAVCNGCILAARKRGMSKCPFCRTPTPEYDGSQVLAMVRKRIDAGDPLAICHLGDAYHYGEYGLEKDETKAVELWERAAEQGLKVAHFVIGCLYMVGTAVEKDTAKALGHYEAAAMRGHVIARHNLGCRESDAENYDLALQHFLISAKMGHEKSLNGVKKMFMKGLATKTDYAEALLGYQRAIGEMRSADRDEALAWGIDNILAML